MGRELLGHPDLGNGANLAHYHRVPSMDSFPMFRSSPEAYSRATEVRIIHMHLVYILMNEGLSL